MYLYPTEIVKNAITNGYVEISDADLREEEDHRYIRGNIEDRGPCPGLNALCNQNYL